MLSIKFTALQIERFREYIDADFNCSAVGRKHKVSSRTVLQTVRIVIIKMIIKDVLPSFPAGENKLRNVRQKQYLDFVKEYNLHETDLLKLHREEIVKSFDALFPRKEKIVESKMIWIEEDELDRKIRGIVTEILKRRELIR